MEAIIIATGERYKLLTNTNLSAETMEGKKDKEADEDKPDTNAQWTR